MTQRLLVLALLLLSFSFLRAQHQRGEVLIEGSSKITHIQSRYFSERNPNAFLLKGGYFLSDRFLIGASLGLRSDQLSLATGGSFPLRLYGRYYFSNEADRPLRPFAELSVGTLSTEGLNFSIRPTLGLEYELVPGLFGRFSLQGTYYSDRWKALTLDFSSSVSLTQALANKDKASTLERGDWVINADFGQLSFFGNGRNSVTGLVGNFNLDVRHFLRDRIALTGSVDYANDSYAFDSDADRIRNQNAASLQLRVGADYTLPKLGAFQPYLGGGVNYTTNLYEYRSDDTFFPGPREIYTTSSDFAAYARAGSYFHVSDRLLLNLDVSYRFGKSDIKSKIPGINLKMMYRFGGGKQ